ncbi:MAG: hypothetical protein IJT91_01170, partial [Clostridia bacterium]|nr:hypothetical protein [Clostridia bacterium]
DDRIELTVSIENNFALIYMDFAIVYPSCMSLLDTELIYDVPDGYNADMFFPGEEKNDPYAFYEYAGGLDADPYAILGCDPEYVEMMKDYPFLCTAENLRSKMKWADVSLTVAMNDDTVPTFANEDGKVIKYTFAYDRHLNVFGAALPVYLIPKAQINSAPGARDPMAYPYVNYRMEGTVIPTSGEHTFEKTETTAPANCKALGEETFVCSHCGAAAKTLYFRGHNYAEAIGEATCERDGWHYIGCTTCGKVYHSFNVPLALGHDPLSEFKIETQPTKETPGVRGYYCSRCGGICREEAIEYLPGDVSGDGNLTLRDISAIKFALTSGEDVVYVNIDVDGDDLYTLKDLAALKKLLAG